MEVAASTTALQTESPPGAPHFLSGDTKTAWLFYLAWERVWLSDGCWSWLCHHIQRPVRVLRTDATSFEDKFSFLESWWGWLGTPLDSDATVGSSSWHLPVLLSDSPFLSPSLIGMAHMCWNIKDPTWKRLIVVSQIVRVLSKDPKEGERNENSTPYFLR